MTEMSEEFDEYTKFGAKLEPTADGSVSKIRDKMFPEVFHLFKKLNIRAIFNAFGPLEGASGYDEGAHGLFADAIKGYGCWCLPNQGVAGQDGIPIWNGLSRTGFCPGLLFQDYVVKDFNQVFSRRIFSRSFFPRFFTRRILSKDFVPGLCPEGF